MHALVTPPSHLLSYARFALSVLTAALLSSCFFKKDYPRGRDVISDVKLREADQVDEGDVLDGLATHASPRFLGIWDGVAFDYEIYDQNVLARDLERIERYYRARGYYEAKVTAARVIRVDEHHVRVEVRIYEGPAVVTKEVKLQGLEAIPLKIGTQALKAITVQPDKRFDEQDFKRTQEAILDALMNNGYAFAKINSKATIDISRHEAIVEYRVTPGTIASYGPIQIVGLQEIPERPVRANLLIEQGQRYSKADLKDARDALVNLGVFSDVDIRQDRAKPESGVVPLTVVVRESSLRAVQLGGGARLDVLRLTGHLRAGWESRNFLGGMRHFQVDTRPGITFFPTRLVNQYLRAPTKLLPENHLRAELRQPSFIEGRTTGLLASEFNIYPLLYPLPSGLSDRELHEERIIGYYEVRAQSGVERAFFGHHLFLTPSYNWQANFPFEYQGTASGLKTIRVSFPELMAALDFRNDPINPHRGFYLSNSLQFANTAIFGDVEDIRIRPEARIYLPMSRRVTLALRTTVGFLFPSDYGFSLTRESALADATRPDVIADQQKLLFRAFFSGGPNSNRGYPFRGVGPQGPVGFLLQSGLDCSNVANRALCTRPLGGLTLWEASMEVRFPISGPLEGATFVDASDVARGQAQFRFNVPHLSAGPGLRYATPVGPIRLDVGFPIPGMQVIGAPPDEPCPLATKPGDELPPCEGQQSKITIFGLTIPMAIDVAFGEAF